jgi:hypothetical protein
MNMIRNKWVLFGLIGLGLLALVILAIFFRSGVSNLLTPSYRYNDVPSRYTGFVRHVLRTGSTTYDSDYAEYGLSATGPDRLLGQISSTAKVYAIPGEDPSVYLVLYDLKSQVGVFRNIEHPAFDLRTTTFKEMRLFQLDTNSTTYQSSTDAQLIQEAITTLQGRTSVAPLQVTGKPTRYGLNLYSDQHPGLIYTLGVFIDGAGKVYLAENTLAQDWFTASKPFTDWVKSFH